MDIVAINLTHDSSTCLMRNGEVLFNIEEERLDEIKHSAIGYRNEIEYHGLYKLHKYTKHIDHLIFIGLNNEWRNSLSIAKDVLKIIVENGISVGKINYEFEEHHLYHAYNGFYLSGFDTASVIVMDGMGNYTLTLKYLYDMFQYSEIESIYEASKNKMELVFKHSSAYPLDKNPLWYKYSDDKIHLFSNAGGCGQLFDECAVHYKMNWYDAGKIMGMSSYGKDENKEDWIVDNKVLDISKLRNHLTEDMDFQAQADVAKKIQEETKRYTIKRIQQAIDLTGEKNIVLTGGYFLNCVNNYEYLKAFPNINFYVDPIAYDAGTTIGACQYVWLDILKKKKLKPLTNLYLGG